MAGPVRNDTRPVQPPRPPNAWILYRSDKLRELPPTTPGTPRRAQAEVSRIISQMWKKEAEDVRNIYEKRADAKKAEHQAMYPGYRFQPMKKEDRDRLREEKRLEKERDRAQSKRARAKSGPYASFMPPPPMPYPSPYYQPELYYGPGGPSPPMSAASSPRDTGPYHEGQYTQDDSSLPQPNDAPPPLYPPALSTGTSSSLSSPSFRHSLPPAPPPPLHVQWHPPVPMPLPPGHPLPGPSHWQQPYLPPSVAPPPSWMAYGSPPMTSPEQSPQNFVTFNMPPPIQQTPQGCMPDTAAFTESIQAFLSGDPSIFQLSNPNGEELLSPPEGEIEVSMGNLPLPLDEFGSQNTISLNDFDFTSPMAGPSSQPLSPTDTTDLTMYFPTDAFNRNLSSPTGRRDFSSFGSADGMLQYVNFDGNTAGDDMPVSPTTTDASSGIPPMRYSSPSPLSPAYSSTRRVGGTWPPSFSGADSPVDRGSPQPWGVPAS